MNLKSEGVKKMGKRRGNGEGSICKRKDGLWQCQMIVGADTNGKPIRKTYYGKSRKEVQDKLSGVISKVNTNTYIEPTKIIFADWLDKWINEYMKMSLKKTTWELYKTLIEKHIKPTIGTIKLCKLQTGHLQNLYSEKLKDGARADNKPGGLSPKSVRHIHTVIHSSLDQALRERIIAINPADAVVLPKNPKKEMKTLDEAGITSFLQAAKSSRYYTAFLLSLGTGLRRGELLGLTWKNVDLENGIINVVQQLVRVSGGQEFSDLKTKLSRRKLAIDNAMVKALKEHRKNQLVERQKNWQLFENNDLVFCSEIGKLVPPRNFVRYFKAILKKASLEDIRLHDFRHTYSLMVLKLGGSLKGLQENLGHYSPSFTLDMYGHDSQDMKRDSAEKVGAMLKLCVNKEITPLKRGQNDNVI
jgi:integrase